MTPLLNLVLLVLIAFIGSFFYKRLKIKAMWVRGIAYSGIMYILLGYLMGPNVFGLISLSVSRQINVLFALVLGWAGFLIGIQTNLKGLKRFPRKYYVIFTINFIVVFVLLLVLLRGLISFLHIFSLTMVDVSLLSVVGALSSPIILGVLIKDYRLDGRLSYRLQFGAALNNLLGVLALEGVFLLGIFWLGDKEVSQRAVAGFLFPIALVPVSVFVYYIIYDIMKTRQEKFLVFLSLLFLSVGTAFYFKQSILFISFLFGVGLANIKIPSVTLYRNIQELEKPLYVLLLIFAGINLKIYNEFFVYALLAGFVLIRMVVKTLAESTLSALLEQNEKIPLLMGLGSLGMGGLSLAVVLDFMLLGYEPAGQVFLFLVVVSLAVNDVVALQYLGKHLIKKNV